jgi:hypothetical protein
LQTDSSEQRNASRRLSFVREIHESGSLKRKPSWLASRTLAAGYGADDQEWFFAGCYFGWKKRVPRFVGEIFGTGEEAQERAALLRIVVADGPAQHRITGFEFIEHRSHGGWNGEVECDLAVYMSQCAEMRGKYDANHGRVWPSGEVRRRPPRKVAAT